MTEPRDLCLTEMSELLETGELHSIDIVTSCFKGFDALNEHLKAFISLDKERIFEQARSFDAKKQNKQGMLGGIPIAGAKNPGQARG